MRDEAAFRGMDLFRRGREAGVFLDGHRPLGWTAAPRFPALASPFADAFGPPRAFGPYESLLPGVRFAYGDDEGGPQARLVAAQERGAGGVVFSVTNEGGAPRWASLELFLDWGAFEGARRWRLCLTARARPDVEIRTDLCVIRREGAADYLLGQRHALNGAWCAFAAGGELPDGALADRRDGEPPRLAIGLPLRPAWRVEFGALAFDVG
jgi:hypothetical protein